MDTPKNYPNNTMDVDDDVMVAWIELHLRNDNQSTDRQLISRLTANGVIDADRWIEKRDDYLRGTL